ncbi:MAG: hypothetical protein QOE88_1589 [Verrucomicrobiota bacterium]|jgi:hypothetical protein|nr:hypothetical protein [Verrucomicrobiota bacterium]
MITGTSQGIGQELVRAAEAIIKSADVGKIRRCTCSSDSFPTITPEPKSTTHSKWRPEAALSYFISPFVKPPP